jgi:transcription termination factor Rho
MKSRSKAESNVNEKKVGKVIKFNKSAYEEKIALKRKKEEVNEATQIM